MAQSRRNIAGHWLSSLGSMDEQARISVANMAWLLVVAIAGVAVTWFRVRYMTEASALWGYEPSALIDPLWGKPEFAEDYRNSEDETLNSLAGQFYHLLGFLPLSKHAIVTVVIFAEFCMLAAGAYAATRAVDRNAPRWIALGTALLIATGTLVNADLARWTHPYYGSAYGFAYGAGLLAFAAILSKRPIVGGIVIGITGAIHPLIALFLGLAMAVAALVRIHEYRWGHLALGAAAAAAIAGGWYAAMLNPTGVTAGEVDETTYLELIRMMSYHWFPFSLGVFGQVAYERLMPFIGFLVLFASVLGGGDAARNRVDVQIGAVVATLSTIAVLGAVISEYSNIPVLIKLALHRGSLAALVIAALVVVPRLLTAASSGSVLRATLAAALLLGAYFRTNGVPVWMCILFAALVIYRERNVDGGRALLPAATIAAALAVIGAVAASGWLPSVSTEPTIGIDTFFKPLFLAALSIALAARYLRQPALLATAFLLAALPWTTNVSWIRPNDLEQARAYLEVQEWAKANTAPDALFMTDPGHAYGWREHSERPSFGTSREWLYAGWGYRTDPRVFNEGLRRAKSLGLDVETYFAIDRNDPGNAKNILSADATRLYHHKDAEWFQNMAAEYGIDYFVLDKQHADRLPALPLAFENARYAVVARAPG